MVSASQILARDRVLTHLEGIAPKRRMLHRRPDALDLPPDIKQLQWIPSPIHPDRQYSEVLAEKLTTDGRMFKLQWRASWVHESTVPDIENVRVAHVLRKGRSWDVLR